LARGMAKEGEEMKKGKSKKKRVRWKGVYPKRGKNKERVNREGEGKKGRPGGKDWRKVRVKNWFEK